MRIPILLLFGFLLSLLSTATAANVVLSVQGDLDYDENGKLASHYLLYPAGNPHCPAAFFQTPNGFQSRPVAGRALQQIFPGHDDETATSQHCPVACAERGTDRAVAHDIMPHKKTTLDVSATEDDLYEWFKNHCKKMEVCINNYHSQDIPIQIYWIAPNNSNSNSSDNKQLLMEIEFGEPNTKCFHSFLGHTLQVQDGQTGDILDTFTVEYITSKAIGESPPSGDPQGHNFDQEIESTLRWEWTKHQRIHRTFSPLGFKKAKLPEDVFASMGSFYYNNQHHEVREEWNGKGVFVNWWETDCYFIQVPWDLKWEWQFRLRELVEAWAGTPVEQTDMYGLRKYVQGARLLTHVDRVSTHAVSLIVNIDQGNLTQPWPVEVNDHADRLHEIIMEPGDIVYYESAKALHGRNRPLSGPNAYYVNLFTHYRPKGDPDWWEKPNAERTPDPVVHVEGDCRLEAVGTTELPNKKLGVVEAVKCDDSRLGNTISPTLFQATSGEDLIEWWQMTRAKRVISSNAIS